MIIFYSFPAYGKLALNFIVVMSRVGISARRVRETRGLLGLNVSETRRALELIVILRGQYG